MGSLKDTLGHKGGEKEDELKTDHIVHRGPEETLIDEWRVLYFRIPYESLMIPGKLLDKEENSCHLRITGHVPDGEKKIILGQPFLNNYYTVLDQENYRIGFSTNVGTRAEISERPLSESQLVEIFFGIIIFIFLIVLSYIGCRIVKKKINKKLDEQANLEKKRGEITEDLMVDKSGGEGLGVRDDSDDA